MTMMAPEINLHQEMPTHEIAGMAIGHAHLLLHHLAGVDDLSDGGASAEWNALKLSAARMIAIEPCSLGDVLFQLGVAAWWASAVTDALVQREDQVAKTDLRLAKSMASALENATVGIASILKPDTWANAVVSRSAMYFVDEAIRNGGAISDVEGRA